MLQPIAHGQTEQENVPPLRSARANKGQGGKVDQLKAVERAIRPEEFEDAENRKKKKTSANIPSHTQKNPMAPMASKRGRPTKVCVQFVHTSP